MKFLFPIIILFLFFLNSAIFAGDKEGFGVSVEGGSYRPVYENSKKNLEYSNYYGFSLDYQWDISELFTFSLIGFEHGGKSNNPPNRNFEYYKLGFLGAEIKAWIGRFFIGFHSGNHYLTWIESINSYTGISYSQGTGYGFGLEIKSGFIMAFYREKSGGFNFEDMQNQKIEGNRIQLGFRWR